MLYNLHPVNVNKNYLARLDFLDLCCSVRQALARRVPRSPLLQKEIIKQRLGKTSHSESQSHISPSSPVPDFMPGDRMELYLKRIEQDLLRGALAINNNNQTRAARQLGISRSGLMKKSKRIAS